VPELDDLIRQSGVDTYEIPDTHHLSVDGHLQEIDYDAIWQPIADQLSQFRGQDISFSQFLNRFGDTLSPLSRSLARSYVEGFNAADARDVSVHWLRIADQAIGQGGGVPRRVRGGFARIVDRLADDLTGLGVEIRLSEPVKAVRWRPGAVLIETANKPLVADRAIVTVPLGVLHDSDSHSFIEFNPNLPHKTDAWRRLKMGTVVKTVFGFHDAPWPGHLAFLHTPGKEFETWWIATPVASHVITGWVGGPGAAAIAGKTPEDLSAIAIDVLSSALALPRNRIELLLRDWRVFDWQAEAYSRGAYMYVPVGQCDAPARIAEPELDTLFFAGEATELRLAGTVGGAVTSGLRAARQILNTPGMRAIKVPR
jgi:monoamine oxidase